MKFQLLRATLVAVGLVGASFATSTAQTGMTIRTDHPKYMIDDEITVPLLRARAGVGTASDNAAYPDQVGTHAAEWAALKSQVNGYDPTLTSEISGIFNSSGKLLKPRDLNERLADVALGYLIAENGVGESAFASHARSIVVGWMQQFVDHMRSTGNFNGDGFVSNADEHWRAARYMGTLMAYDYLYNTLHNGSSSERDLLADWAVMLFLNARNDDESGLESYYHEGASASMPYFPFDYKRHGGFITYLTVYRDPEVIGAPGYSQTEVDNTISGILEDERNTGLFLVNSWVGASYGYVYDHTIEDVAWAKGWESMTDETPFENYAGHFDRIADWTCHYTRSNYYLTGSFGDAEQYPFGWANQYDNQIPGAVYMACRDDDRYSLAILDKIREAQGPKEEWLWAWIMWNDRADARVMPTGDDKPLSEYFGDTTHDDGGNSEYCFFRSDWNFDGNDDTVVGMLLCGYYLGGHDGALADGHLAIFRGKTFLTTKTGIYDLASGSHNIFWAKQTIGSNAPRLIDPGLPGYEMEMPYDPRRPGDTAVRDGGQAGAPQTALGYLNADDWSDFYSPVKQFRRGQITAFKDWGGANSYVLADITMSYPHQRSGSSWDEELTTFFNREIMFLDGEFFVVHDRVDPVRSGTTFIVPTHVHAWSASQIHLLDGATWSGPENTYGGTPGMTSTDGHRWYYDRHGQRLHQTVVYPPVSEFTLEKIGGPSSNNQWERGSVYVRPTGTNKCDVNGTPYTPSSRNDPNIVGGDDNLTSDDSISYEFYSQGLQRNFRPCEDSENAYSETNPVKGYALGYRVEIQYPLPDDGVHNILHVYQATDDQTPTTDAIAVSSDADHLGVELEIAGRARVCIFSRDDVKDVGVTYQTNLIDVPFRHHLAGLAPGVYFVEGDRDFTATFVVDEQGAGTFESPHGGRFAIYQSPVVLGSGGVFSGLNSWPTPVLANDE